jgi:AcrR family transcriptional regulator
MAIPHAPPSDGAWAQVEPELAWNALDTQAKHERILCAAGGLFASEGIGAPMPAVAALAGAGVGSLYRQFPSKRELLAALVIRRLGQIEQAAVDAATGDGDHWRMLTEMLWTILEDQAVDDFLGEAWTDVEDHAQVQSAAARTHAAIERLLELARAQGTIREDASALDVRLLFVAARASRQVDRDAWQRVFALMLDGLAATPR